MSSSTAPLFPKTSVFIPAYWESARGGALTQEQADALYLKFPVGQGTESIPNLIVSGTSTLGITSASTLSITDTTNSALTIGNGTSATGNMNFGGGSIQRLTTSAGTNQILGLLCQNTTLTSKYSAVNLRSGNNTTGKSSVELVATQADGLRYSDCFISETNFDVNNYFTDGEINYVAGVLSYNDAVESNIPVSLLYSSYTSPSNNYIGVRCRTLYSAEQVVDIFTGSTTDAVVNIASFSTTGITLYSSAGVPTASFTSSNNTFFENLTFSGYTGVLEKSNIETSTSGNFTMTSANSFQTTINTPTANRNFILPAPAGQLTGTFYGICNKSTSFTIAVQSPSGTTIFTIPVATNATNGGSFAKFAINLNGATNTYFRCG